MEHKGKALAKTLFFKTDMIKKDICEQAKCSLVSLNKWISDGRWVELKEAETVTKRQLLADAYKQLKAVNCLIDERGGVPDKEMSDAKSILRKEIESFSDNPLHIYVECFENFIGHTARENPELLKTLISLTESFMESLHEANR
jgi:hypothetical protein